VRYRQGMRYPQGGGLTAERQQFREELRLKAAERFAQGETSSVIAKDLRVSVRSVQRWRRIWNEGGRRALRSQGPASLPRLSEKQFAQLEAELPFRARVGDRGDHPFAADRSGDAEFTHETLDGAAGHRDILTVQVAPDLPGSVDAVVGLVRLRDQGLQLGVSI
jgi:transposase